MAKKEQKRVASRNTMRFDAVKAQYGVDVEIVDEFDNYYGTFKISLLDSNSKFFRNEVQRVKRQFKDDKRFTDEVTGQLFHFVQTSLHGWDGIVDDDGNEIPFSKDAAFSYFSDLIDTYVVDALISESTNLSNFQGDPVARQEEAAGN